MKVLDLFSGIGGFSLAARRVGWETVAFCEIDPYCQKVLAKHWPGVPIYEDVRNVTAERLRADGIFPDIITGGFPCQDLSNAGKRAGIEGERSGLWSELARIIGEIRPQYAVLENVSALLSGDSGRWFQRVLGDLAEIGYDCEWHCIPASHVGAPHRRDRVWIVAYPQSVSYRGGSVNGNSWQHQEPKGQFRGSSLCATVADTECQRPQGPWQHEQSVSPEAAAIGQAIGSFDDGIGDERRAQSRMGLLADGISSRLARPGWLPEPGVGRVASGVPDRVHKLKGLGNAIVPAVAEVIFRAINEVNPETTK